ncbi:MAG: tRNA glutamyl-Q(34) synthetase GluQRS [Akkermansiaceae bacterium]|jgi:glutamyl-Q tRNA(Asp) synthetase|nr:tRNA glutamyl-Q(34) synthetase GluQRS [Akkermansiaceae bacterium]
MIARTRFAPSPTGRLHLGHVLAARIAHTIARQSAGGVFLLRHEDIDGPRVREKFYTEIEEDLQWLGISWDEATLRQSSRSFAYEAAIEALQKTEVIYPCFCTRKKIQDEWIRMGAAPHGNSGHIYPKICQKLSTTEQSKKMASGTPFAWRFDAQKAGLIAGPQTFTDLRHGVIPVIPDLLGDVILARKDIGCAYHLAVVVDDSYQRVTHVTRGEDLLASTHVHRTLQALLGLQEPIYLHHPLVLDEAGERLAKRNDACSIRNLRENGLSPKEVLRMVQNDFEDAMDRIY